MTIQKLLLLISKMKGSHLLAHFCKVWLREFSDLIPERARPWLFGRGRGLLSIAARVDEVDIEIMAHDGQSIGRARTDVANFSSGYIEQFARAHGFDRRSLDLGVRLPATSFFRRKLVLPAEAEESVGEIAIRDLLRKTPFQLRDIFCDHVASRIPDDSRIVVWQWVVLRDVVAQALAKLGPEGRQVVFADADIDRSADAPRPFIWFGPDAPAGRSWSCALAIVLTCAMLSMMVGIAGLRYWRQEIALADLGGRIAIARADARKVRADIETVQGMHGILLNLHTRKNDAARLLDIWEEVTRLLPSHSWITELKLGKGEAGGEQQITMTGYSDAATSLISTFDRSPFFTNAALTAPVTFDPVEKRDRFALRLNVSANFRHVGVDR